MLKRTFALALCLALSAQAQKILPGMGKSPADYVSAWGKPDRTSEGPFGTREQIWSVTRKKGFGGQTFQVHVLFRNEKSMEERWVRPGQDLWEKEELWTVLDGKASKFEMRKQGTNLTSPFTVLQAANNLINFTTPHSELVGQLQNTLEGPQLRFTSREWAQAQMDMGLSGQKDIGRVATQGSQSRIRPTWGGKSLQTLLGTLKETNGASGNRTFAPKSGKGSLTVSTKKGTRLELVVPDLNAQNDANRILTATDPGVNSLRDALRDSFRRFYGLANFAVPGMMGSSEWSYDRVEGVFSEETIQDLIAIKHMPAEFPLLVWKDPSTGESWNLVSTPEGYKLTIQWQAGREPK
ncbi:MAG: hypothetical protein IPK50_01870 [Fibrobacterota bacterium]|nr:hypothetical protein [Fibrobacterota bacterium]QQS05647.1 MAG: hypothetical protein IPK50_01870 [Fibrobacterota bacterium]